MPQIGPLEIIVVAMLALIVFGPEKLPGMLRTVGKTLGELRRMASEVKSDFSSGLNDPPDPDPPKPAAPPTPATPETPTETVVDGGPE
ncbi:MAG TPA: twin-arginine translocase TatA/TatE family subunit [Actinomycetota bacterium]|nr:twin-arginine translocase TatA/TatE family subunit [Actinomycetota bacterium]